MPETLFVPPNRYKLRRQVVLACRAAKVAGCDEEAAFERGLAPVALPISCIRSC